MHIFIERCRVFRVIARDTRQVSHAYIERYSVPVVALISFPQRIIKFVLDSLVRPLARSLANFPRRSCRKAAEEVGRLMRIARKSGRREPRDSYRDINMHCAKEYTASNIAKSPGRRRAGNTPLFLRDVIPEPASPAGGQERARKVVTPRRDAPFAFSSLQQCSGRDKTRKEGDVL